MTERESFIIKSNGTNKNKIQSKDALKRKKGKG